MGKFRLPSDGYNKDGQVPRRIMDGLNEFFEPFSFGLQEEAGFFIPSGWVDIHEERSVSGEVMR